MNTFSPLHKKIIYLIGEYLLWYISPIIKRNDNNNIKENRDNYVAILEPNGLGDSITILGLNKLLKEKYPHHKTIAIINESWEPLFMVMSEYDEVISIKLPWAIRDKKINLFKYYFKYFKKYMNKFSRFNIEYAYEVRGDIRNQFFLNYIGAKKIISWDHHSSSNYVCAGFFLSKKKKKPININRVQLNSFLICDEIPIIDLEQVIVKQYDPLIIHIGAGSECRKWKKEKWERLINLINEFYPKIHIKIITDKEDIIYNYLKKKFESKFLFKITSLIELYDIVNSAGLFIGLDSGVTHLASFLQKPVIDLFGPGLLPLWEPNARTKILIHHQEDFPCAPCNQKKCIRPMRNCMDSIEPNEVFEALQKVITNNIK